jgi:DNA-binding IclR family transcriptional regulator
VAKVLLALVRNRAEAWSAAEIALVTKLRERDVHRVLQLLASEATVWSPYVGRYRLRDSSAWMAAAARGEARAVSTG